MLSRASMNGSSAAGLMLGGLPPKRSFKYSAGCKVETGCVRLALSESEAAKAKVNAALPADQASSS